MVEQAFWAVKSVLEIRPIYYKSDDTIPGHVFCSFLAMILMAAGAVAHHLADGVNNVLLSNSY